MSEKKNRKLLLAALLMNDTDDDLEAVAWSRSLPVTHHSTSTRNQALYETEWSHVTAYPLAISPQLEIPSSFLSFKSFSHSGGGNELPSFIIKICHRWEKLWDLLVQQSSAALISHILSHDAHISHLKHVIFSCCSYRCKCVYLCQWDIETGVVWAWVFRTFKLQLFIHLQQCREYTRELLTLSH